MDISNLLPRPDQETLPKAEWIKLPDGEYLIAENHPLNEDVPINRMQLRWTPKYPLKLSNGVVEVDGYYIYWCDVPKGYIATLPSYETALIEYTMRNIGATNASWSAPSNPIA